MNRSTDQYVALVRDSDGGFVRLGTVSEVQENIAQQLVEDGIADEGVAMIAAARIMAAFGVEGDEP